MAISFARSPMVWEGTVLNTDLHNQYRSYGIIEYHVKGVPGEGDSTAHAQVSEFVAGNGLTLFPNTNLPMSRIAQIQRLGEGQFKALAYYSINTNTSTSSPEQVARFSTGQVTFDWIRGTFKDGSTEPSHDSSGRPNGDFKDPVSKTNRVTPPTPYSLRVPAWVIAVWGVLDSNPAGEVGDKLETVNVSGVTFGGFQFPAKTLRFDGAVIDWYEENGADKFPFQYVFTHVKGTWADEYAYWDLDDLEWQTEKRIRYKTSSYSSGFPTS